MSKRARDYKKYLRARKTLMRLFLGYGLTMMRLEEKTLRNLPLSMLTRGKVVDKKYKWPLINEL